MDALDQQILQILAADGRATWAEIAERLSMSPPAIADRVRKLEDRGVIKGYTVLLNPASVGSELLAFVFLRFRPGQPYDELIERVSAHPNVLEAHHVAGEFDFLVKFRCGGVADLERIVVEEFRDRLGCERTNTVIALSTAKETSALPIRAPDATAR